MKIQYLHTLPQIIRIPARESWVVLDEANNDTEQTIILDEWARLDLYGARTSGKLRLDIVHEGAESASRIRCGFHASSPHPDGEGEKWKIEATIKSRFQADRATSEIRILSLADAGGEVLLDSAIDIQEGVKQAVGRLKERHIFLGSAGKIRGIPALVVHSDDIEASHALAIDRISDEELFYLRSRGFSRDDATGLLLEGAVSEIFEGLSRVDEEVYKRCRTMVLGIETDSYAL